MNQIVPVEQTQPKAALVAGGTPRAIVPSDFEGVWRFATVMAASGMAPKDFNTPEKISVAVMHGMEVGLTPMMAMQSIAIINNRPSIWGDGAMGLVRGSGLCEGIEESVAGEGDARKATCVARRKGEKMPIIGEFSVADARKANLWGKTGPWTQYPDRMLKMRARAFALRDAFADVLRGLAIGEEMQDVPTKDITPPPPPRGSTPPVPPAPDAHEPAEASAVNPPAPEMEAPPKPPEWSVSDYLARVDAALGLVNTEEGLQTAWKAREQPQRKLVAAEITELTGLRDKHKARIAALPVDGDFTEADNAPEVDPPAPPAPPPSPDAHKPSSSPLVEIAEAKAKTGLKRFNMWINQLSPAQVQDLAPYVDELRTAAAQVRVDA